MRTHRLVWVLVAIGVCCLVGCSTAPKSVGQREELSAKVQAALDGAKQTDPGLQRFFNTAAGYAVFPDVGKGAVGVGGAYGRGQLFQKGQLVGYCSLTQASVGLALGGQAYTEIIFFEDQNALDRFKSNNYAFAAQASAVALKSGASANAQYADGVAVFTMGEAGLMVEASVGGQKFSFEPLAQAERGTYEASSR
ncbi:MAG: YSC84-related protein [Solirubrobacterales bacterium]